MIVYRLSKTDFCRDLSGRGAEIWGGRWNSKGQALLYTCESRALCVAEIAVHTPLGVIPLDYNLSTINFPEYLSIQEINNDQLPLDWKSFPHSESTQIIGNEFIRNNKFLIFKVPSAVVQGEYNYLINPGHPDFHLVKILQTDPFLFDERLFK